MFVLPKNDKLSTLKIRQEEYKELLQLFNHQYFPQIYILFNTRGVEGNTIVGIFSNYKLAKKFIELSFDNIIYQSLVHADKNVKLYFYIDGKHRPYYKLIKFNLDFISEEFLNSVENNFKNEKNLLIQRQLFLNLLLKREIIPDHFRSHCHDQDNDSLPK